MVRGKRQRARKGARVRAREISAAIIDQCQVYCKAFIDLFQVHDASGSGHELDLVGVEQTGPPLSTCQCVSQIPLSPSLLWCVYIYMCACVCVCLCARALALLRACACGFWCGCVCACVCVCTRARAPVRVCLTGARLPATVCAQNTARVSMRGSAGSARDRIHVCLHSSQGIHARRACTRVCELGGVQGGNRRTRIPVWS